MAWTRDRANRARWATDQKVKAKAAMAAQFAKEEAETIAGLHRMLAACAADPSVEAAFGNSVRAKLARQKEERK